MPDVAIVTLILLWLSSKMSRSSAWYVFRLLSDEESHKVKSPDVGDLFYQGGALLENTLLYPTSD